MKHFIILGVIVAAIGFLLFRSNDLDNLMKPASESHSAGQVGNRFVEIDQSKLPMTVHQLVERGVVTVVVFHDDDCYGCKRLSSDLDHFSTLRPDVAIRKVAINVAKDGIEKTINDFQWPVWTTPHVLIFDKAGKIIAADHKTESEGFELLEKWIETELVKSQKSKM